MLALVLLGCEFPRPCVLDPLMAALLPFSHRPLWCGADMWEQKLACQHPGLRTEEQSSHWGWRPLTKQFQSSLGRASWHLWPWPWSVIFLWAWGHISLMALRGQLLMAAWIPEHYSKFRIQDNGLPNWVVLNSGCIVQSAGSWEHCWGPGLAARVEKHWDCRMHRQDLCSWGSWRGGGGALRAWSRPPKECWCSLEVHRYFLKKRPLRLKHVCRTLGYNKDKTARNMSRLYQKTAQIEVPLLPPLGANSLSHLCYRTLDMTPTTSALPPPLQEWILHDTCFTKLVSPC